MMHHILLATASKSLIIPHRQFRKQIANIPASLVKILPTASNKPISDTGLFFACICD